MTDAFRLLADGFGMAGNSGVKAELHPSSVEARASPYARLQPEWKAILNGNTLDMGLLALRVPDGFLARSIRAGTARVEVTDKPGSFSRIGGMAARDGEERYWIAESCIDYRELEGRGFELIVAFALGEPDLRRFGYAAPVNRTAEVYAARLTVPFSEIFSFVFPITQTVASELHNAIAKRTGMIVPLPVFFVNE